MAPHLGGMRDTVSICEHTHTAKDRGRRITTNRQPRVTASGDTTLASMVSRGLCCTCTALTGDGKYARTTQSRKQQFTMGSARSTWQCGGHAQACVLTRVQHGHHGTHQTNALCELQGRGKVSTPEAAAHQGVVGHALPTQTEGCGGGGRQQRDNEGPTN